MENFLHRNERTLLWVVVVCLTIFVIVNYISIGRVDGKLDGVTAALNQPRVRASVLSGVPADLTRPWKLASAERVADPRTDAWLSERIENAGYHEIGQVLTKLAVAGEIREIYAVTADGETMSSRWMGPEVTDGGKGTDTVSLKFPSLDPGQEHWVFVGLDANDALNGASSDASSNWKTVTVTAKESPWSEGGVTSTLYGTTASGKPISVEAKGANDAG
jgi:hypothetical protein